MSYVVPGCYHGLVHDIWRSPTYHESDEGMRLTRTAAAVTDSLRQFVICRSLSSSLSSRNSQTSLDDATWLSHSRSAASPTAAEAALAMTSCNVMSKASTLRQLCRPTCVTLHLTTAKCIHGFFLFWGQLDHFSPVLKKIRDLQNRPSSSY